MLKFMTDMTNPEIVDLPVLVRVRWHELLQGYPPERIELPDHLVRVVESSEDASRLFATAGQLWRESFDAHTVEDVLAVLESRNPTSGVLAEVLKPIKAMRKSANILFSGYKLFDINHRPPYEHWWVVKVMGALKDYFGEEEAVAEYADGLRMSLVDYDADKTLGWFKPDSKEGFESFLEGTLKKMQKILTEATPDDLKAMHDLRKKGTRVIMNLFQLASLVDGRSDWRQTFYYFKYLDEALDKARDKVVGADASPHVMAKGLEMEVPAMIRDRILRGIEYLREQWDLELEE